MSGLSLLLACGGGSSGSSEDATETTLNVIAGVAPTTDQTTSSSTSSNAITESSSTESTTSSEDTSNDDDILFDLGVQPEAPPMDDGCAGIDFLFVIDNSGSMGAQQTQLLASFDGFIPWQDVSCVQFTAESPNLIGFVDAFGEQGIKASICDARLRAGVPVDAQDHQDDLRQLRPAGVMDGVATPFGDSNNGRARSASNRLDDVGRFATFRRSGVPGAHMRCPG